MQFDKKYVFYSSHFISFLFMKFYLRLQIEFAGAPPLQTLQRAFPPLEPPLGPCGAGYSAVKAQNNVSDCLSRDSAP